MITAVLNIAIVISVTYRGVLNNNRGIKDRGYHRFPIPSGVARRGGGIGQLPNNSEVIAQRFFEMLLIAQCRKILIHIYVQ
jgi:hypothetical protein